jgi:formylglycine-generating enzyme required for sulfatase activity
VNAVAWYASNAAGGTKAVGTKAANELFIHDMTGNVFEWCEDVVYIFYRSICGGSWEDEAGICAVAYKSDMSPAYRLRRIGFRLARSSGN